MKIALKYVTVMFLAALPMTGASAQDAVLDVTPGNYKISRETTSSDTAEPIVNNEERCIRDKVFNPVSALPQNRGCTAKNVKKSGNTVTFDITCTGGAEMPPMTGKAEYSSNGMAIGWNIEFKVDVEGKTLTIVNKAEGKRVGDCK
ncbi:MAG: DUF3617 family protein [Thermodesulfobacteriota bacterium]